MKTYILPNDPKWLMVGLNIACFENGSCNNVFFSEPISQQGLENCRHAAEDAYIWWFVESCITTGVQQQRARTQEVLWKGLMTAKSLEGCIFEAWSETT